MRLLLVRHGETAWNRAGRVQGWAPVGLTERGREQAERVGDHLAGAYDLTTVHGSDLRRARQTAAVLAAALDVSDGRLHTHPEWRERDFGVYQGLTDEEVLDADPDLVDRYRRGEVPPDEGPPSGESPRTFRERVLTGLRTVTDGDDRTRVVVTHNNPIVVVLSHVSGRSVQAGFDDFDVPNGSLSVVEWDATTETGGVAAVGLTEFE
ncbi:histidine phosphatase family protein [Halomarina oriensis]|uniref:Histidine phosphatase family protein n=1 Tax=Halomarina oriensis TaxID=671145 RepID=A0A6B0GS98_9EURY|nr:histidine phosphatase family protein [Halomarina oriensis]